MSKPRGTKPGLIRGPLRAPPRGQMNDVVGVRTERSVLTRIRHPFIVKLRWAFHTPEVRLHAATVPDRCIADVDLRTFSSHSLTCVDRLCRVSPTCRMTLGVAEAVRTPSFLSAHGRAIFHRISCGDFKAGYMRVGFHHSTGCSQVPCDGVCERWNAVFLDAQDGTVH